MTNDAFTRIRALVTAGRALLTAEALHRVRALMSGEARDRAVFLALSILFNRFCDRLNHMSAELKRCGLTPELLDRLRLLGEARNGLNRSDMSAALDHLVTPFAGISAFDAEQVLELLPHGVWPSDPTSDRGEVGEKVLNPIYWLNPIQVSISHAEASYRAPGGLA